MNDLLERILELPLRQRVLLVAGAVGLLFLAYAYWSYWPRNAEIESKSKKLVALQVEVKKKKKLAADLPKARQTVEELKAGLRKAVAQLPDTKEIPGLLSSISGIGRQAGLEIFQFRQLPSVVKDFYAEVPVQVTVRGDYFQLAEFFKRVGEMTRIVNVRNITIKAPNDVVTDPVRVETSCAATTFRFLTEEERAAIERAKKNKKGRR